MKTKLILFALIAMITTDFSLNAQTTPAQGKKILIAYYSLRNGNTRLVAEEIQKNVGGDIFRIETTHGYPSEYRAVTEQARRELDTGFRPPLKANMKNFSQYDIVFIGSPNWWGTIAPTVMTFLESNDFKGKTIVPFITHEGSRLGRSAADIAKLAPGATLLNGLPVRGSSAANCAADVKNWTFLSFK